MVKHRTAIVIDETQFALLVAGAAVCVMTPFADVEICLSSTVRVAPRDGRPTRSPTRRRIASFCRCATRGAAII